MSEASNKKMTYVRLGNSGLKVSRIILGTMQYGSSGWQEWVLGEEEAIKHIKHAYDAGIQTFDTANARLLHCAYSNGLSEVILGNAIKKLNLPRDEIVIMTKLFAPVVPAPNQDLYFPASTLKPEDVGIINQKGLSRKVRLTSLAFFHTYGLTFCVALDHIDVLQCHRFDNDTPIEETMQALHDVVQAGYVRYIGMSSCWAWQFHAMQNYAINNKLTPFISMQNHHSLLYREEEREMFPTLRHDYLKLFGVGSIPWSPLARGLLTRPFDAESHRGKTDIFQRSYVGPSNAAIINRVEEIAKKRGISMAQVAIAWSLGFPGITAPIVGTTNLNNLKDIIDAVHIKLTEEETKYLEEAYIPQAVIGHA
ncbi:hypothetical protein EIP91_008224 [Steccherinum ochraceum]|uniref:NADP-dependent oxidoreductase domain-containing protein n=1 Tax=Steccherinum ochraceum TaxID=92696 RepID=A0A4R0RU99_9APHY|nr:hypothetical protein EIP91_008224 [Steccherinum ochraceum]